MKPARDRLDCFGQIPVRMGRTGNAQSSLVGKLPGGMRDNFVK
jgi:hypothetical protein